MSTPKEGLGRGYCACRELERFETRKIFALIAAPAHRIRGKVRLTPISLNYSISEYGPCATRSMYR